MDWFYDMLINSGVAAEPASWATAALAVLLVYCVIRGIALLCHS